MSIAAIDWAFKRDIPSSSVKFVLVALADYSHPETGEAFPSIESISTKTSQDRKTVIQAINQLVAMGLITETGKRVGSTGRIKVYRFPAPFVTVPKKELLNSPTFPSKQSQISAVIVPNFPINGAENGTQIRQGTVRENNRKEPPPAVPQGGPSASEFVSDVREAKALICKLILGGRDPGRPWSAEADVRLAKHCQKPGMPRYEIETIGWFRRLPKDEEIPELLNRRDPITETTLMNFWGDEFQRGEAYLRKWRAKVGVSAEKKEWPARFLEWLAGKYPEALIPDRFDLLPHFVQDEWHSEQQDWEKNTPVPEPDGWRKAYVTLWGEREDIPPSFYGLTITQQHGVRKKIRECRIPPEVSAKEPLPNEKQLESEG